MKDINRVNSWLPMMFVCSRCQKKYLDSDRVWVCNCGGALDLDFTPCFHVDLIEARPPTMWRYREALPVSEPVSFAEGFTPLVREVFKGIEVYLKLDYLFPSGSFKDRGASVMMSRVRELGFGEVVEDSSGNAGAAVAAYSAKAGIDCTIYVPESTGSGKLTQIASYGATVRRVSGSREDTSRAILEAVGSSYYASHIYNPYFIEGTKTFAFEVCEQLGWGVPDSVVVPVGHGSMLLGTYFGFKELLEAGVTDRMPRIIGVQSESCSPLAKAWMENLVDYVHVDPKPTVAEGISISEPVRAPQILEAVKETNGHILAVSEEEIISCLREAFRMGYYIEPTSATVLTALGDLSDLGVAVIPLTGTGLKATEKLGKFLEVSDYV
jgi:threonine synthase